MKYPDFAKQKKKKLAKNKFKNAKNSIRVIGKIPEVVKEKAT